MSLALCMIARNEQQSILHTLDSVRGLVDEIVIAIDPTSDDKTWETVETWLKAWDASGAKWTLTQGKSVDEVGFAEARNCALEHVKSDWILILDADERLPEYERVEMPGPNGLWYEQEVRSHDYLRVTLANVNPQIDLLHVKMMMLGDDGKLQSMFQAERLIRRGLRFEREMHNVVSSAKCAAGCEVAILHTRKFRPAHERIYRGQQRLRMAEKFFLPRVENDPDDARSLFYLAGSYGEAGDHAKAVDYYLRYLEHPKSWPQERYQAAVFCGRSLLEMPMKTPQERAEILSKARRISGHHIIDNYERAELYVTLGMVAQECHDYKQAKFWYQVATLCAFKVDPHFVEAATHTWLPWLNLASVHFATGNTAEAMEAIAKAKERGAPQNSIDHVHKQAVTRYGKPKEVGVFIDRGDRKFIEPFLLEWGEKYRVWICEREDAVAELLAKVDTAWFEWAGPMLVAATKLPHQARMIVRVHGYELHSGLIPQVDWSKVDTVIFVAEYLKDIALRQAPQIAQHCQVLVIHGGIQAEHFTIAEGKQGNKIAMAGYINSKKDIGRALEILFEARKQRPQLELHIAGTVQDSREWLYIGTLCEEFGFDVVDHNQGHDGDGAVHFYPWQDDLNAWFADKDYILSTSHEESFHYAVAQGMAAGLQPVIHCWRSSRDFYLDEWICRTTREAVEMLTSPALNDEGTRFDYRQYVLDHLSHQKQAEAINLVMDRVTVAVPAPDGAPWRFEGEVARALENMGYAGAPPQDADIVLCLEGALPFLDMPKPLDKEQRRILWYAAQVNGKDKLAVGRRKRAKQYAGKVDALVASVPTLGKSFGATLAVYQGGAKELWRNGKAHAKNIDVSFFGSANPRRTRLGKMLGKEWNVQFAESNNQMELADLTQRSKIALNIHWTNELNVEARISEVLASGTFLLTEKLAEGHPFPEGLFVEWETAEELHEKVAYYLEHETEREEIARRGSEWVWANMTVAHQVKRVLEVAGLRPTQGA